MDNAVQSGNFNSKTDSKTDSKADGKTDGSEFNFAGYFGADLGAVWMPDATVFKLWAPTAVSVETVLYDPGETGQTQIAQAVPMKKSGAEGSASEVWIAQVPGDLRNAHYMYHLTFENGEETFSPDPYAKAAAANGLKSVVLSPEQTQIDNFERMPSFSSPCDAIIAEMHVRDFTSRIREGLNSAEKGKFLGVVRKGLRTEYGNPAGFDYLVELGVTHVQLQPIFDFGSVDETAELNDDNYNWGYDPVNYNVPEGSYSSNPHDPAVRIIECKKMIKALHDAGIRVITDVVFNHVYDEKEHPFALTVPGYFFRRNPDGTSTNCTFCGNDTASERVMMRKYIVDSVKYLAQEYNLDGFRFDLMGLHDLQTMKDVRAVLDEIDPGIIILGEGWNMQNPTLAQSSMAIQANARELAGSNLTQRKDSAPGTNSAQEKQSYPIAFFNDDLRDALRGPVMQAEEKGFVSKKHGLETELANEVLAHIEPSKRAHYASPQQVVQYAEVHDNRTLFDHLRFQNPNESKTMTIRRAKLATVLVFASQGITEFELGQEIAKTKEGIGNSYKAGDSINGIDWERLDDPIYDSFSQLVKQLIKIRRSSKAFRMNDYEQIAASTRILQASDGVIAWQIKENKTETTQDSDSAKSDVYTIIANSNDGVRELIGLQPGIYDVLANSSSHEEHRHKKDDCGCTTEVCVRNSYQISGVTAMILKSRNNE